jgi:H+/Cl- antiporter ClcA
LAIVSVNRIATRIAGHGSRGLGMASFLLAGGLAVGLIALLADGLGADSEDVLFSGQSSIPALVAEGSTAVVLVLLAAKALAYAVSLACGFRGGPIFPAAFLGIGPGDSARHLVRRSRSRRVQRRAWRPSRGCCSRPCSSPRSS